MNDEFLFVSYLTLCNFLTLFSDHVAVGVLRVLVFNYDFDVSQSLTDSSYSTSNIGKFNKNLAS